jgi:hypothetical protein
MLLVASCQNRLFVSNHRRCVQRDIYQTSATRSATGPAFQRTQLAQLRRRSHRLPGSIAVNLPNKPEMSSSTLTTSGRRSGDAAALYHLVQSAKVSCQIPAQSTQTFDMRIDSFSSFSYSSVATTRSPMIPKWSISFTCCNAKPIYLHSILGKISRKIGDKVMHTV